MWVHGIASAGRNPENNLAFPFDPVRGTARWTLQAGDRVDIFVPIPTAGGPGAVPTGGGESAFAPALVSEFYILYNAQGGSIAGIQLFDGGRYIGDVFNADGGFVEQGVDLQLGFEGPFSGDHSARVEASVLSSRNRFRLGGTLVPISVALGVHLRVLASSFCTFDLAAAGARFEHTSP